MLNSNNDVLPAQKLVILNSNHTRRLPDIKNSDIVDLQARRRESTEEKKKRTERKEKAQTDHQ